MNAAGWKLIYALAACGVYALSAWEPMSGVAGPLHLVAGGLLVVPYGPPKHAAG